jgi:hypothetical protein
MARFYANENFPLPTVEELRRLGHDVLTTFEAGEAGRAIADADVLAKATGQDRAVLTFNRRDFIGLHTERPDHAGIIVCTFDVDFAGLARRVHAAVEHAPVLTGQLLRVSRPARA